MVEFKKLKDVFSYSEMDPWWEILGDISQDLERLEMELAEMREQRERLEEAGMYPGIPTESWQSRNGSETEYLRLIFPRGTPDIPAGSGGRKRLYIGCDPAKIEEARRMVANREQWEGVDREVAKLEHFLDMRKARLEGVAWDLARYQVPDLGTEGAQQPAPGVPKEEAADGI